MTLYDIDHQITELIDSETGELLDYEAFAILNMERDQKIENMALWHKDLIAEARAIKLEIESLTKRKQSAERKAERLKQYLDLTLDGQKFSTPRCSVSYRKTSPLEISDKDALIEWAERNGYNDCVNYKEPDIYKKAVSNLVKNGIDVPFVQIVTGRSLGVK